MTVRYRLKGTEKDPELTIFLAQNPTDGEVYVRVRTPNGYILDILGLTTDGTMRLYNHIPSDVGLELDTRGYVQIRHDEYTERR